MKPILRFTNFDNDWEKIELLKIASEISYGMNAASKEYDGENKYIRITDIDEKTNKYIHKNIVSPDGNLEKKFLVKENDILFARTGASTGKTYLYDKNDGKLYYAGFLIKANIINHNANFIFQQTKLNKYNNWVKIMSMRSGQPGINSQEYGSYKFSITSPEEENKVSNFLSLLDKKIELQTKKIEDLKLFKKGLLISKFSNKVKNKKLEEIIKKGKAGGTPKSTVQKYYDGTIPFLSISDISSQNKYIKHTEKCISEEGLKNSSTWLVPKNSIILSMYASYGLPCINKIELATSQAMYSMFFKDDIDVEFIYYYLYYLQQINYYDRLVSTGTQSNLNAEKVNKIKIYCPNYDIQKNISKLFVSCDRKILLEANKLLKLQELKKGLMQNMFV